MKNRRRRRWSKIRASVVRAERCAPTPETLAKLELDPLAALFNCDEAKESRCGTTALERASDEIRAVYMAVTRSVMCKRANPESQGGGRGADIPDELAWAHLQTYMPWANCWRHGRVLEAVIDLVVDRYQSPPASRTFVIAALADYAKRMRERPKMEGEAA